jgi:hypothetical protein
MIDERESLVSRWVGGAFAWLVVSLFFIGPIYGVYVLIRGGFWWAVPFMWMGLWAGVQVLPSVLWPYSQDDRSILERLLDWHEERAHQRHAKRDQFG